MKRRIFGTTFLVASVMILLVSILVFGILYNFFHDEKQSELRFELDSIAAGVEEQGIGYLTTVDPLIHNRITYIAADGVVMFDSEADVTLMDNHLERDEVQQAIKTGYGISERYSDTVANVTIYSAKRMSDGAVIRVSSVTDSIIALLGNMVQPIIVAVIIAIIICMFISWYSAKRIVKPINEIDLNRPEEVVLYDELSPFLNRIVKQKVQLEQRLAEMEYQRREFDTITANMQEGLLVLDNVGHVISYNKGALCLMDINPPEKKQSVYTLNRSEHFRLCIESALQGKHCEDTVTFGEKVCQLFANPVMRDGEMAGIILVLFDMTERERREALRREFTANVSHELKTPLTSISGFAEIIKNDMVREEDIKKFAGNIYDEAQRLILLVRDIIKLSELDEKHSDFDKEQVELSNVIKDTLKRLEPIATTRNITFKTKLESAEIFGVEQVLSEMVYNICDNAIRYNKEDGSVDVQLSKTSNEVRLSICDTGMGIPPAEQERVFERFYRVDHSRNSVGSGLGLSIVKHGAQLHNATIEMDSKQGEGSCFILHFPI